MMDDAHWARVKWWDMAFADAAERLAVVADLPGGDARSGIIADGLRESAVLAVMRVFGTSGDRGPGLAANHDKRLSELRDAIPAAVALRVSRPEAEVHDLLERVKKTRNLIVAHASGKAVGNICRVSVRVGDSRGDAVHWEHDLYLEAGHYTALQAFCEAASDHLGELLAGPGAAPPPDSL